MLPNRCRKHSGGGATSTQSLTFSCVTLAQRHSVPGNPNLHVRVLKLTFEPGSVPSQNMHRHKYGEIVYLLSGSGADQTIDGKKTPLTTTKALFIPPTEVHAIVPTGSTPRQRHLRAVYRRKSTGVYRGQQSPRCL